LKATPSEHLINLVGVIIIGIRTSLKPHAAKIIMITKFILIPTMVSTLIVTLTTVYIHVFAMTKSNSIQILSATAMLNGKQEIFYLY